jgi:anaphase-promoting complex subunit 4
MWAEFAVSGSRKVGIVLAENRRKVRLYEMEGEEEEDEDADMTNSTMKESDMSVQDVNISTTI